MKLGKENFKVQIIITSIGVLLLVVKTVAYFFTHSLSVLTDALESIVNVVAGFIGLYSLYVAAKPKDVDHPYGHGKAELISAAAEGTLIVAAGVLIIYETLTHFLAPNHYTHSIRAFGLLEQPRSLILLLAVFVLKLAKKINHWHYKQVVNICK